MPTNVIPETLAKVLSEGDPNRIADAFRAYGIGMHLSPQKFSWLGSTGATAVAINTAAFLAAATPGPKTPTLPASQTTLPAILEVGTLRVTTGPSGSVGAYTVTDAGGTAQLLQVAGPSGAQVLVPGLALLSDDGSTLTFPVAVSGFVLEYIPCSALDVTSLFEHS
jgi:hypothetical protein